LPPFPFPDPKKKPPTRLTEGKDKNILVGGKTVHVVSKYLSRSLFVGRGRGGRTNAPPLPHPHYRGKKLSPPFFTEDILLKDDVASILLGVSFMVISICVLYIFPLNAEGERLD
jgi:hypothetical protein